MNGRPSTTNPSTTSQIFSALSQAPANQREATEENLALLNSPPGFCAQYGETIRTAAVVGGMAGGIGGLALSIVMIVKPDLFASWNVVLAIYTCLFAPAEGAVLGSAASAGTATLFYGVKQAYENIQQQDEERGYIIARSSATG